MLVTSANWLGLCSLQLSSIMCAPGGDDNLKHTLSHRDAGTCLKFVFYHTPPSCLVAYPFTDMEFFFFLKKKNGVPGCEHIGAP